MTPLSDALTAAQRRALAALEKAYVAGLIEAEDVVAKLAACGIKDQVELGYLLLALDVLREWGAPVPAEPEAKADEKMSDKQRGFIEQLAREKDMPLPDFDGLTKAQASEIIDSLQAGSYDPQKWQIPF